MSIDSGDVNEAQEIQKLFNQCTTLLAENVEKRRVIQNRLNRVLKPLEAMEDELRKQLEDNDFHLAKMMSRLEDIDLDSSKLNSRENFVKCLEEAQEEGQKITDIMSGFEKNSKSLFQFKQETFIFSFLHVRRNANGFRIDAMGRRRAGDALARYVLHSVEERKSRARNRNFKEEWKQ